MILKLCHEYDNGKMQHPIHDSSMMSRLADQQIIEYRK